MNKLQKMSLSYYNQRLIKLEKKANFYQLNLTDKNKLKLNKIKAQIMGIEQKISEINLVVNQSVQAKIASLKSSIEHEQDLNLKEVHKQELDTLETKEALLNDPKHVLSLSHLTMKFGGLKAVDDLSFVVNKGEIFGLIGPNGAGKTTVFNCITQFYKPTSGEVFYTDRHNDILKLTDYKVHNIIDLGIARTFQNVELVWELSVLDNLLVGGHSLFTAGFFSQLFHLPKLKKEEAMLRQKASEIIDSLGLTPYKYMIPYGLPYGILKKIELARVLMTNPSLIILDEPAAGLNDSETKELAKTIKDIKNKYNLTIILVEHDMELVMEICDRICAMSFGQKLAIGTPSEIQSNKDVQTAYLGGE
ncbi:MAG: ABC transporter ATP-binding protein [Acholeplasma sp.]|nr:ABC transporter ATP-binding protein [Acholeplasma sp.]